MTVVDATAWAAIGTMLLAALTGLLAVTTYLAVREARMTRLLEKLPLLTVEPVENSPTAFRLINLGDSPAFRVIPSVSTLGTSGRRTSAQFVGERVQDFTLLPDRDRSLDLGDYLADLYESVRQDHAEVRIEVSYHNAFRLPFHHHCYISIFEIPDAGKDEMARTLGWTKLWEHTQFPSDRDPGRMFPFRA